MKKIINFITEKRNYILIIMLIITSICAYTMNKVNINQDMTKYLPSNSSMKKGLDILEKELPDVKNMSTIWVMIDDLETSKKLELYNELKSIPNIYTISYDNESDTYNKDNHTLYILTSKFNSNSKEMTEIKKELDNLTKEYNLIYELDSDTTSVPIFIIIFAFIILLIILLIMCSSWIEPILFIITIGIAIIINLGTNYFLKEVSYTTYSIAAILQLVLTMDYSIMLLNRYREEKKSHTNIIAMKEAIKGSFPSIMGSSFTTIVGLLALIFMSFKIGTDLGIVLAKGVLISLICIFTVLPSLILMFDKLIYKTHKKSPHINMEKIALFSQKYKYIISLTFIILFTILYFIKGTNIVTFNTPKDNTISKIFKKDNNIVLLYENKNEDNIDEIINYLTTDDKVKTINTYKTTVGKKYNASELDYFLKMQNIDINKEIIVSIYKTIYQDKYNDDSKLTLEELINFIIQNQNNFKNMINDDMFLEISNANNMIQETKKMFVGESYSIINISASYKEESKDTFTFIDKLDKECKNKLNGKYYFIGNSIMNYEMSNNFNYEMNKLTIITIVLIFLVVLLTFKSVIIPLILVLLIQCAVYLLMTIIKIMDLKVYYLSLLIVQSILMGATIDYAILFTNYYLESRKNNSIKISLKETYNKAIHTILTSSMIMIIITGVLGFIFTDPAIGEICHIIAIGVTLAVLLILFVLPSIITLFDKYITKKSTT